MADSRQVEQRAAEWLLRREDAQWSALDQSRLEQWLDASLHHRVAFLRLEAGWKQVDRIQALGAGLPSRSVPSAAELVDAVGGIPLSRGRSPRNRQRFMSAAAAVLLVVAFGLIAYLGPWSGTRYATPMGGVSTLPLSDGSSITLNTASRIRVRMNERERRIDLVEGEAFFDVAPDATRPFVVQAGARRIVAVGTQFSVRLDGDDVRIVVTEGIVKVENADGVPGPVSRLGAGAVATSTPAAIESHTRSAAESEDLLSWRYGFLVFEDTALADALSEFKRYDGREVVIRDPAVAAMRLTGKFRANNLDAFVRLLESTSPVRAEYSADRIVLSSTAGAG